MLIEQIVGNGHRLFVPLRVAGLVAAEQKQRRAARIKRVEHSQVPVLYLASQLLPVRVAGSGNHVRIEGGAGFGPRSCNSSTLALVSTCSSGDKEFHQVSNRRGTGRPMPCFKYSVLGIVRRGNNDLAIHPQRVGGRGFQPFHSMIPIKPGDG